jgi:lysosomal acid lipase/cholesteryl ester hydrolase
VVTQIELLKSVELTATMNVVPVIGRLSLREYVALLFSFLFIAFEIILRIIISVLPKSVITWFYERSRALFHFFAGQPDLTSNEKKILDRILRASDFGELCNIFGYTHEEHVVLTKVCSHLIKPAM